MSKLIKLINSYQTTQKVAKFKGAATLLYRFGNLGSAIGSEIFISIGLAQTIDNLAGEEVAA